MRSLAAPRSFSILLFLGAGILPAVSGCEGVSPAGIPPRFSPTNPPLHDFGRFPSLHADSEGNVFTSWTECDPNGTSTLRFSSWDGAGKTATGSIRWTDPKTVSQGESWFVNWADFPTLCSLGSGRIGLHWLEKSGPGTFAYDVRLTTTSDSGATWTPPVSPHHDGTETEHGFVSILPDGPSTWTVVWLDGRATSTPVPDSDSDSDSDSAATHPGEMALRAATLDVSGTSDEEKLLDSRVCSCCQTGAARTKKGAFVVYRDRSDQEVRDLSYVFERDGVWSDPKPLDEDGWKILGCPVNGPQAASWGTRVAVAWFTIREEIPQIRIAFSENEGETFGTSLRLDEGQAIGRVDVEFVGPETAWVSWIEATPTSAQIRVRPVHITRGIGPLTSVGSIDSGRESGFPRMARAKNHLLIAWTEPGDRPRMRFSVSPLRAQ